MNSNISSSGNIVKEVNNDEVARIKTWRENWFDLSKQRPEFRIKHFQVSTLRHGVGADLSKANIVQVVLTTGVWTFTECVTCGNAHVY